MKQTEEKIKETIVKVYKDLELTCDPRYPIKCTFVVVNNKDDFRYGAKFWSGSYDYREIGKYGEEFAGLYPEYILSIDDETGEAFALHHYSGHMQVLLNKEGKYVYGKQLYRPDK